MHFDSISGKTYQPDQPNLSIQEKQCIMESHHLCFKKTIIGSVFMDDTTVITEARKKCILPH